MGRKLKVELIENKKSRNLAFKRRKECLVKKITELSTLCDVNACMILYAPDHDAPTAPVTVWPPNDSAQVRRLIDLYRAKVSKKDDDGDEGKAQFGVSLQKKAQLVRSRIDELKQRRELMDTDQQQQDQFGPFDLDSSSMYQDSSTAMMMPRGPLLMDDDELKQRGLMGYSSPNYGNDYQYPQQQQYQLFGQVMDLDSSSMYQDSSTAMMMPRGPLLMDDDELKQIGLMGYSSPNYGNDYQYPQQQQYQLFGPVMDLDSSSMYQDSSTAMMMPRGPLLMDGSTDDDDDEEEEELKQRGLMGYSSSNYGNNYQYPQQQQYQLFGPVMDLDSSSMYQEDSSTAMMLPSDLDHMKDDTCCGMGFDEQTSRETAGDDQCCNHFYGDDCEYWTGGGLITQLYTPTPPRPLW